MNQLQYEKSPYLLQHAGNPVDWRPWGTEAFCAARREDKPVFLSIGYSTCHWCHVMAHESFEDEEVAAAINRSFIPIKVDREERPDVDAVYMEACVAVTGSGGWPLTLLLTPEQKPFWAGTYLRRDQLLGLLAEAARLWDTERDSLRETGDILTERLREKENVCAGAPDRELVENGVLLLWHSFDRLWGGFGRPPKFPCPHQLLFLLRCAHVTGDRRAREMAETTLEHMYRGGIFDHIGGGFCRYSTDRQWLAPHFEKMLYDNALLALVYTEAFAHTRRPYYRETAGRTLDYVLRELTDPLGGFYCGQDADSGGEEGKYYLFSPEELARLLGAQEAEAFCRQYGISECGNFAGKSIPNRIAVPDWEQTPESMASVREKVYDYRLHREPLSTDDKVLTSWNGLMIAALARAGLILEEPRYLRAAEAAAGFIGAQLTDGKGGLLARWREGEAAHPGKLEDYAFFLWGLLELYGVSLRAEYLERACSLAEKMLEGFFDPEEGGFYPYAAEGEQLITRKREVYDGALPSGNAAAALVLSRLRRLTGEERWRRASEKQLRYLTGAARDDPSGHCFTFLVLLEELWPAAELICASQVLPAELTDFLREKPRQNLTVLWKSKENEGRLAAVAPFTKDYPVPAEGARYYLCRNNACASPVNTVQELEKLL